MIQMTNREHILAGGVPVEQQVTLDDASLHTLPEMPSVPGILERLRRLEAERRAAFGQMHRMVADIGNLKNSNRLRFVEHRQAKVEGLFRLARVAEFRSGGSPAKILRTGVMGAMLASMLGYDDAYCDPIQCALPLLDLGEIALPEVLLSTAGWSGEQRAMMQGHCQLGHDLLAGSDVPEIRLAAEIALTHHERFDGLGYPYGLSGAQIPLAGRIAAVVDCFDACSCVRPYRGAMSLQLAMQILLEQRGKAYDPVVVDAFHRIEKMVFVVRWLLDDENCHPELKTFLGKAPEPGFWRRFL